MNTVDAMTIVKRLQDNGFAVVIFTPEEMGDTDPENLEDHMIMKGWDYIHQNKTTS